MRVLYIILKTIIAGCTKRMSVTNLYLAELLWQQSKEDRHILDKWSMDAQVAK